MDAPKQREDNHANRHGRSLVDDRTAAGQAECTQSGTPAPASPITLESTRFAPAPNGLMVVVSSDSICTFERTACRVSLGPDGRTYFVANEQLQIGPLSPESYVVLRRIIGIPFVEQAILTDAGHASI
ncbi:hypothetical protein [Burkholderia ubonensis]|uniref:Uncharacterized protein n=1 Tax=Burkholderia ubonensis TaxID=101571 RepID=A0A125G4H8_9BURK|nr:hypothetical protein [Burkholderia ubonensis]KWD78462.1 hypothetical protein WL71_25085 [Burkholderia ubonensis]KWD87669.1 hypothetical protein WL70_09910 [Burkholderia ubonensis]KWD89812.1 hypothetical protein WL72_33335 [Burkholderia ubonensis]KWD96429.1 hypothetical protein WL73_23640 [Burkholderia ubonensis]